MHRKFIFIFCIIYVYDDKGDDDDGDEEGEGEEEKALCGVRDFWWTQNLHFNEIEGETRRIWMDGRRGGGRRWN